MKAMRLWVLVASVALLGISEVALGDTAITGSFVQLDGQLASFSYDQWEDELSHMAAIGMDTLIVQYSVYGDRYYYPSRYITETSGPGRDESVNELIWRGTARARYVRIVLDPTSVEWTMLAEVTASRNESPISLGSVYSISASPDSRYPDPEGKKLTDGSANWSWNDMVGWRNPTQPIVVTLDLGQSEPFDAVTVKFMRSEISNVQLPVEGFAVQVSTDGSSFMSAGSATWEEAVAAVGMNAIETILQVADDLGVQVFLGLGLSPEYWSGEFDARNEAATNQKIMTELQDLYGSYGSLAGWYLPEELDDRNFNTPQAKEAVVTYLKSMVMYARFYTHRPVMVSPYFGINPDGTAYAQWWDDVLSEAKVDIVAMQDGVGTRRTTIEESASVFAALQPIMEKHDVQFWANIEVFDQIHGWPVDAGTWQAIPATSDRVSTQLALESPYVQKVVIFEFSHYMSPRLGGKAEELYHGYIDNIQEEGD
jgi:hypothetical protein